MSKVPYDRADPDIYLEESLGPGAIRSHYHNMQQILFIREGTARIIINKKEYAGTKNSIFFISNLESHSIEVQEYPCKRYVLSIPSDFSFPPLRESYFYGILLQRPENFSHMIRLDKHQENSASANFEAMLRECREKRPGWQLMIASRIARLLVELYRSSPSSFPENPVSGIAGVIFRIQKEIAEKFDKEITLDGFAERYFVSKYHLSREFKRITGYNFREYLILYRIAAAKDLLAHTNMPVAEAGARCGYQNVNHFIRIFKNTVGKTPYQYKKSRS